MKFLSEDDYPISATTLASGRLKEICGEELDHHQISSVICEFILGLKELGYSEIEINSVRQTIDV